MIKNALALALVGILLSCGTAPAFAKGFSGGRSYSRPAITRNVIVRKTTVVHEHNYNGGGGNGLLTGMLVGHMLSQPAQAPVIVQQTPVPQQVVEVPQQQVIAPASSKEEESSNTLWLVLAIGFVGGVAFLIHKANKSA